MYTLPQNLKNEAINIKKKIDCHLNNILDNETIINKIE